MGVNFTLQLQEAFGNILNKSSNMMKKILSFMLCSKILPVYKWHSKSPLEAAAASHNFIIKEKIKKSICGPRS